MHKEPDFWKSKGWLSTLLLPLSWLYRTIKWLRGMSCTPMMADIPIICIGNVTVGGAGKTPLALALGAILINNGVRIAFVSRGYGGMLAGPVQVDPVRHSASQVGDEPLLLSRLAPVFVSRNRQQAVFKAQKSGARLIIMDDGFQNPTVHKDVSLLVIDGAYGLGNGRVLPSGPLRETLASALQSAEAVVMVADDNHKLAQQITAPVFNATIKAVTDKNDKQQKYVAFAGIARPEKFFNTLQSCGYDVVETISYADHYAYQDSDMKQLLAKSSQYGAQLVTTEKDAVRLPKEFRSHIVTLPIQMHFDDKQAMEKMLEPFYLQGVGK